MLCFLNFSSIHKICYCKSSSVEWNPFILGLPDKNLCFGDYKFLNFPTKYAGILNQFNISGENYSKNSIFTRLSEKEVVTNGMAISLEIYYKMK